MTLAVVLSRLQIWTGQQFPAGLASNGAVQASLGFQADVRNAITSLYLGSTTARSILARRVY